jgi:hypothetical protein
MAERRLEEWERDLVRNVDDKAVRDLVSDFKNYSQPTQGKAAKVTVTGAGTVVTGTDGAAHTPYRGWSEPPKVDAWKPPGLSHMDAMLDQQDAVDKAARVKEFAEAKRYLRAHAEAEKEVKDEIKERQEKKGD